MAQGVSYVHQDHEPVLLYIRTIIPDGMAVPSPASPGPIGAGLCRSSRRFSSRNSHMAYKDSPFGGCAYYLVLATVMALYNLAGLTSSALHRKGLRMMRRIMLLGTVATCPRNVESSTKRFCHSSC